MDYETWMKNKEECQNEAMRPWCKMSELTRIAMIDAHAAGAKIETLTHMGAWVATENPGWHVGTAYRVSPSCTGPAKPDPKPEYEDCKVLLLGDGTIYTYTYQGKTSAYTRSIDSAVANSRFAGYVYEDDGKDKLNPIPIFDPQPDGTYRLRVPKAVRFMRGAWA